MMPIDMQLREVARTYMKLKKLGHKPKKTFSAIARDEFNATDVEVLNALKSATRFMKSIGIPKASEEGDSPCHKRPALS